MQGRYREICDAFRREVPERLNMDAACCGRRAGDRDRIALHSDDEGGRTYVVATGT
jgi:hypothetical protein